MSNRVQMNEDRKIYTVSELTRIIKLAIEDAVPRCWLVGEVSNLRRPREHIYFTLKDENAQIGAVIWRSVAQRLRFELKDGREVLVYGRVDVYAPHGKYQVIVERVEPKGIGALQLAFQQLHEKLEREGLFDPRHKKPIPFLPRRIGVITSDTGAAIKDILTVLTRRFPCVNVLIHPVKVQGEGAAEDIARAIERMNRLASCDVLIVGRGGGSIEDLWAFNEEVLARAIFASRIPIISAVGHERDLTISDLVADKRALTPSEAAELCVPVKDDLLRELLHRRERLRSALLARVDSMRLRLQACARSYALRHPIELVRVKDQRVDELSVRLDRAVERIMETAKERWRQKAGLLHSLSPLKVLERGYSVTIDPGTKNVIRDAHDVQEGQAIETIVRSGRIRSRVESTGPSSF